MMSNIANYYNIWKENGIKGNYEYALLTNDIYKTYKNIDITIDIFLYV